MAYQLQEMPSDEVEERTWFILPNGAGYGRIIDTPSGRSHPSNGQAWATVFIPPPVSIVERRVQSEFGIFDPSLWPTAVVEGKERLLDDLSELTFISQKAFKRARERGWRPALTPKIGDHFLIAGDLGELTFGTVVDPLVDFTAEEREEPRVWDPQLRERLNNADRELRKFAPFVPHMHHVRLFSSAQPDGELESLDDRRFALLLTEAEFEAAERRNWRSAHAAPVQVLEDEVRLFERLRETEARPSDWSPFASTFAAFLTSTRLADPERYKAFADAMALVLQGCISSLLASRVGVAGMIDLFGTQRQPAAPARRTSKKRLRRHDAQDGRHDVVPSSASTVEEALSCAT